jgi:hypothetical protein
VFILRKHFVSKYFAVARGTFNNAYHNKGVPNKTTIHRLLTFKYKYFANLHKNVHTKKGGGTTNQLIFVLETRCVFFEVETVLKHLDNLRASKLCWDDLKQKILISETVFPQ